MVKYTEKRDKPVDRKLTKSLTPAQKKVFEKADAKQKPKPKTMAEDKAWDRKTIAKIKKKGK
jgi:hypothetical protein